MNIARNLRDIADDLRHWAEEFRRGEEPNIEVVKLAVTRLGTQAEMLDEGLHE
jgi:hypothetical protein